MLLLLTSPPGLPKTFVDARLVQVRSETDVVLWLVSPDRVTRYPVTDYREIRLVQGPKLQDLLTVTLSKASTACLRSFGGLSAIAARFEGWSFDLDVRGSRVFMGPRQRCKLGWQGKRRTGPAGTVSDPTAVVTIDCEHFYTRLTRDRKVYGNGSGGAGKFSRTDTWLNIARKLVIENCCPGAVEPTDWDTTGTLDRAKFGPNNYWTVTCPAPSGSGSNLFAADFGDNLHDTLDELCDSQAADSDKLWPTCVETSAGVFAIDFLVGRSGGSRGIGSDKTSLIVSPEMGNLLAYDVDDDGAQAGSHWQVAGKGRGTGQLRRYKADTGAIAVHGLSEDSITIPNGTANGELDNEAQRQINERAAGSVTHALEIVETTNFLWPTHFGIKDTITVFTPLGDANTTSPAASQQLQLLVIGIEWKKQGPKPPELRLVFGRWPTHEGRRQGRSGGGGSGGRGGGGRPRPKDGQSTVDPDTIVGYAYVVTQNGIVDAEGPNHYLDYRGRWNSAVVRVRTRGTDSATSDSAGGADKLRDEVIGDYFTPMPDGANGYMWAWADNLGVWVQVLCYFNPAAAQPSPSENT